MSHFTTLATRLVRTDHLKAALADLGLEVEEGELEIRGFGGQRTPVELKVRVDQGAHEVGFRRSGGAFEVVADWYGIRQLDRLRFPRALAQRYAYHATRAELAAQGFDLVAEETTAEGTIHLTVRRMA